MTERDQALNTLSQYAFGAFGYSYCLWQHNLASAWDAVVLWALVMFPFSFIMVVFTPALRSNWLRRIKGIKE